MKNGIYKARDAYFGNGTACLRMYNIDEGRIVWRNVRRMRLSKEELVEYGLRPGDILVNRVNSRELVGKAAVIPDGLEVCVFESKNIRLRVDPSRALPQFVSYCLQADGKRHFAMNAQQVVGMASITQGQIAEFSLPLPSLSRQQEVAATLDRITSAAESVNGALDRIVARAFSVRQSILTRAFSGQLVPQDPNDEPASVLLERIRAERVQSGPRRRSRRAAVASGDANG